MKIKLVLLVSLSLVAIAVGTAYGIGNNPRANEITNYEEGHTHDFNGTRGAVQHSGGTDSYGCHNGSVPYHCH